MREDVRRGFERHGVSILGRSIVAGLLTLGFITIAAGSAASIHWNHPGPPSWSKTTQSITFTSTPPSPAVVGATYTATASGGASGNPVTFSIDSSAHGSCSIAGATVTLVAVGTCVIDANQAGNANYEAATQLQQSFAVLGTQSITFTSTPPSPALVGATYTPTASGGASGNPVTFSIDSSAHGSCSISGAIVTLVAVGTCVIDANQAGSAGYGSAGRHMAAPHMASPDMASPDMATPAMKPRPRSSSPSRFSAPRASLSPRPRRTPRSWEAPTPPRRAAVQVATRSPSRSTRRRTEAAASRVPPSRSSPPGPVSSTPTRPATPTMKPRPRSSSPTIRTLAPRASPSPRPRPAPRSSGGTYTPTASGGASGNPVTFSIDSSADGSCSISGATVTFVAVGTCVIDANQAGNASYEAATPGPAVLRPGPWHPEHHLHLDAAQPRVRRRHLHRHGERRGKWQPGHLLDRLVRARKLQHRGCHRHARRRRDLRHRRQPGRQRQLRGRDAGPAVLRSGFHLADHRLHLDPAQPRARRGHLHRRRPAAGQAAIRSPSRSTRRRTEAAASSGATVTLVAVGTCVIDANQAGNANYEAATQVQQSFAVLGTQSITFTSTPPSPAVVGADLHRHGQRRGKWQPGHLLDRLVRARKLQHRGCHRHARRRRDLCHRRQPGRQRQLRSRDPGPAVLRGSRHPEHHLHLDPAQPRARGRHLHPHGERRGKWQPGHLLDRLVGARKLQHLGCHCHARRRRDLRRSTPTRPATPTMKPRPNSSSPSRFSAPRASPSPRPRPAPRSSEAPTPPRRAAVQVATRSPSRSTRPRTEAAASRVPPSRSSPSGPA